MKPLARAKELAKQATLAPVVTEEMDEDAHLNKTLNPVINETDILAALVDEEETWIIALFKKLVKAEINTK